ncbi:hypothetical protein ACE1AT_04540 [Pelatocladus sp. BLCC-F211]|uniref:hypothetical protein n=1 Tax=Pelatocladus sp. BLCC-F211 TaxID=3342752 RepID=UPI0035B6D45B
MKVGKSSEQQTEKVTSETASKEENNQVLEESEKAKTKGFTKKAKEGVISI